MILIEHDPDSESEPRGFDWTDWLTEIGDTETITASTWAVTGSDSALTLAGGSIVTGNRKTQIKLSGGTVGLKYTVTNHVTTSSSVEDDRSFRVLVVER